MRSLSRAPTTSPPAPPHTLEREVCRQLLGRTDLHFSSLVVRRLEAGVVCLEGTLCTDGSTTPDVETLVQEIAGVAGVLNHLVIQHDSEASMETRRICRTPR